MKATVLVMAAPDEQRILDAPGGRPPAATPPYLGHRDPNDPVTSAQRVYLMSLLRDVDIDRPLTREERVEWASAVLETDVMSFTELTYAQASRLIDAALGWHMMTAVLRLRPPTTPRAGPLRTGTGDPRSFNE